jgi:hypothetical protein
MPSRLCLTVLLCCLVAPTVRAQAKVIHVFVESNPDKPSQDIAILLRGKIGSTLRYALTDFKKAEITISLVCVDLKAGVACAFPTKYYPEEEGLLHEDMPSGLITGDKEWVAQNIFDEFVAESSDDKLKKLTDLISYASSKVWTDGFGAGIESEKAQCEKASKTTPKATK